MAGDEEEDCLVCRAKVKVKGELECRLCLCQLHFLCAFGSTVNNPKVRTTFKQGEYTCPVCIIAKDNALILKAVSTNQKYLAASSNVANFNLSAGFFQDTDVSGEEDTDDTSGDSEIGRGTEDDHNTDESIYKLHQDLVKDNFVRGVIGTPPPIRRQRDFFTEGMVGIRFPTPHDPADDYTPLHERDVKVAKTLSRILNTLVNLPTYRSTLLIGDSNGHFVKNGEIDPDSKSVAVRAVSGLCVVAAAQALREYKYTYPKVKKLIWCIGPNDCIHSGDHCQADWPFHLKSLVDNSGRVFPNATVTFITPFKGLPKVPIEFVNYFIHELKELKPKVKSKLMWTHAPSMKNKVSDDGVHLNHEGKDVYLDFLRKHFTKFKSPNSKSSTRSVTSQPLGAAQGARRPSGNSNREPLRPPPNAPSRFRNGDSFRSRNSESLRPPRIERRESFRVVPSDFPNLPPQEDSRQQHDTARGQDPPPRRPPPWQPDRGELVLVELSEAISHMLALRRRGPTPASRSDGHYYDDD